MKKPTRGRLAFLKEFSFSYNRIVLNLAKLSYTYNLFVHIAAFKANIENYIALSKSAINLPQVNHSKQLAGGNHG